MSAAGRQTVPAVSGAGWRLAFLLALWTTMFLLLLPGDAVLSLKVWVASWLPFSQALEQSRLAEDSDKWVHFSLFAVLGTLATQIWQRQRGFISVLLGLVALAAGTEFLQHYIPGRGASGADFAADVVGLALGVLALKAIGLRAAKQWEREDPC